jgi:death-on-curing protein
MPEWKWISLNTVLAIHEELLADYGGLDGVRNMGGLESALSRPYNLLAYSNHNPDAAELAAMYAVGIATTQHFADGNKRTAWATTTTFLELNDCDMVFDEATVPPLMVAVARGEVDHMTLSEWFRARIRRR